MTIRFKVNLELSSKSVAQLLTYSNNIHDKINGNFFFSSPHPTLAALATAIAELTSAAADAIGGSLVDTTVQNNKRLTLENLLNECGHYVEDVANEPGNAIPEELPIQIIESAGMKVKNFTPRQKQIFAVMAGLLVGTVKVTAETVKRGFHEWQYTYNPVNESSWINATSTVRAKINLTDLTIGSRVYVRHRAILKSGPENWTSPESVIVP